ncbi:MAG: choice-of-anchor Q domain-containing protein [Gemmataceae bacterium]
MSGFSTRRRSSLLRSAIGNRLMLLEDRTVPAIASYSDLVFAIQSANASGSGVIDISANAKIQCPSTGLSSFNSGHGENYFPIITGNVTIEVEGSKNVATILGNPTLADARRFFEVRTGGRLTLNGLKLDGGHAVGSSGLGGAVYVNQVSVPFQALAGTLNFRAVECTFTHNMADISGGAVYSDNGNIVLQQSAFETSNAEADSGTFANYARVEGGAVWARGTTITIGSDSVPIGLVTIENSTFQNNRVGTKTNLDTATNPHGGAIFLHWDLGANTSSTSNGGAQSINYSTITRNSARGTNGNGGGSGGGLYAEVVGGSSTASTATGVVEVSNTVFAENTADNGLARDVSGGVPGAQSGISSIKTSYLFYLGSQSTVTTAGIIPPDGTPVAKGTVDGSNIAGINNPATLLSPLDFHQGRTRNRLPGPNSPLLNAASTDANVKVDQRGLDRPDVVNGAADIGAVELQPSERPGNPPCVTIYDPVDVIFKPLGDMTGAVNHPGGYPIGTTIIDVKAFTGSVADGSFLYFAGQNTRYTIISHADSGGATTTVQISPGLTEPVTDSQGITVNPQPSERTHQYQIVISNLTSSDFNFAKLDISFRRTGPSTPDFPVDGSTASAGWVDLDHVVWWVNADATFHGTKGGQGQIHEIIELLPHSSITYFATIEIPEAASYGSQIRVDAKLRTVDTLSPADAALCNGDTFDVDTLTDRTNSSTGFANGNFTSPIIAMGSDRSKPSEVVAYDSVSGIVRYQFYPFGNFSGGVHVATGDVTGDGIPDMIISAAQGGGPHVKIYDGETGYVYREFFAYGANFSGGVYATAADLDGDGRAEVITGAGAGGGPLVRVFKIPTDNSLIRSIRDFYAYDPGFHGGVSLASADVNHDGVEDIITGAGPGGGPHVRIFSGLNNSIINEFYAYGSKFHGGVSVAAGDIDLDGRVDIVTGPMSQGGPHIRVFDALSATVTNEFFAFDWTFNGGVRVGLDDVDGDGELEIVAATGPGTPTRGKVFRKNGTLVAGEYLIPFGNADVTGAFVS